MIFKDMARLGSLGFTLVGCTFLGLGAGYVLDRKLGSAPWLTIGLLLVGIGAGFFNIFNTLWRMQKPPEK